MTPKRAKEAMEAAKKLTTCGPWCDQLGKVLTPEEDAYVKKVWESMPGDTNYMNAFYRILHGRVDS